MILTLEKAKEYVGDIDLTDEEIAALVDAIEAVASNVICQLLDHPLIIELILLVKGLSVY